MSITTRNFARITKKSYERLNKIACIKKGTEFSLSYPFQKRPSVAFLFCQQLVVCQVTFRRRRPLPSSVRAWLGLSGPLTCLYWQVCVSWPRPPRPNQSQLVLSLYFTQRGMHVKGNTYTVLKNHDTVILNKKTCYTERCIYSIQYSINVKE